MKNIEITANYYFRPWVMVASSLFLLFSIALPLDGAFISIIFTPLSGFLLALFGLVQFFIFCLTKELFEFNPETKKYRKGIKIFSYKTGKWLDFDLTNVSRLAFQKYEETIDYNYGGIFHPQASADIFELRMINNDESFTTIINGGDIKSIAKIVQLGNAMSEALNLPFYDYIRDLITKKHIE